MRLFSLLSMAVAAIFFAGSVSAHHKCYKQHDLGKKVYQVCKKWRDDQGGPMPESEMQHCLNVLCTFSKAESTSSTTGSNNGTNRIRCASSGTYDEGEHCVNDNARANAKAELGYW